MEVKMLNLFGLGDGQDIERFSEIGVSLRFSLLNYVNPLDYSGIVSGELLQWKKITSRQHPSSRALLIKQIVILQISAKL